MLSIQIDEVEALLVMLLLDGRIEGSIDGVHHVLQLKRTSTPSHAQDMQSALHHWSGQVHALALAISHKQGKHMSKWTSHTTAAKRLVRTK